MSFWVLIGILALQMLPWAVGAGWHWDGQELEFMGDFWDPAVPGNCLESQEPFGSPGGGQC